MSWATLEDADLTIQKNLPNRFSKWKALAVYVYDKCEGIELKDFGFGDETAVYKELMATKQLADRGPKKVSAGSSGILMLSTGDCQTLPLLKIDKGACAPTNCTIQQNRMLFCGNKDMCTSLNRVQKQRVF